MFQTGKLAQAIQELNKYNITFLGMSETRWSNSGKFKTSTGEIVIWSGRQDNAHREGVALLIHKNCQNTILQWEPVNERLLYVRFNSKYTKISVIVGYAPIEDAEDDDKDNFYSSVQSVLDRIPKHDMVLLIGDFNARVGSDNQFRERTMGKHGLGRMTDNGERLVNLCEENDLVIGGTLFTHKDIHKLTWTSPDGRTQSQIDHIIINGKWRHSLLDVRVMRHADVGSDHNLVTAKIRIKLRKARIGDKRKQKLDIEKLKNPRIKEEFGIELRNKFSALQDETTMSLAEFNVAIIETGEKVLGHKKYKKKPWISANTMSIIEERREVKKKLLDAKSPRLKERIGAEYRNKDKDVKNAARQDRRQYIEGLATEAEHAAEQQDMKTVYQITKKLKGDFGQQCELPVKAEDGRTISNEDEKLKRWKEHFQKILNRPNPPELADIPEAADDLDINLGDITLSEVKDAIKMLKNNKAPGEDQVCAEMLKAEDQELPVILLEILQKIWNSEEIPDDWNTGIIIKLPKKGDLGNCNNWRGITLLSLTSKVFNRIILQRIKAAVDGKLRQEQAGFRAGRSCVDHIFTLRQILEQSQEWNSSLYVIFVDFEKAFDSLHRDSLWKIMRNYGIPQKLVNLIKAMYDNFQCKVLHNNNLSEPFRIETGVKQGCILSPTIFSIAIDWIMRQVTNSNKRGIQWTLTSILEDLDYADDLGLLSSRHADAQGKTEELASTAFKIGLKVNTKKTQVLRMNAGVQDAITLNDRELEDVDEFTYLGSIVTTDGDCTREINMRISKAGQAFAMLKTVWRSQQLSTHTKIRIFKSNVLSVLLYGSECWKTTTTIEKKLDVFQTKCLRRILQIFWPNRITNEEVYERTSTEPISMTLKKRRWKWLGHVCRMNTSSITRIALRWTPQGKRNRGRPRETWRRTIEKELKSQNLTLQTAPQAAADRDAWRSLVRALSTTRRTED